MIDPELEWPMQTFSYADVVESRELYDGLVGDLLASCKNGELARMTELLDNESSVEFGINANSYDNDDATPLQVAAANGHVPLVESLISRGADPMLCNQFGWTPLMHAAYHGHAETVDAFMKASVNVNSRSFLENCPLKLAAREGHTRVVNILLDHGSQLETLMCSSVAMSCDYNLTPLMVATFNSHDDIVRIMLDRGADANAAMRPTGLTVLMLSVLFAELTTAQMLLNKGADPEATNVLGQTAYDLAVATNRRDMVGLLEPYTKSRQEASTTKESTCSILEAVYEGNKNAVDEILKADPAMADYVNPEDGSTPLIVASMLGRLDIVITLVNHGASLNRNDQKAGWTALMQATYHGKPAVAKYLINQGADVNLKSYDGYNAFDLAAIVQLPDDGGLLSLLAYRIAEQNAVKTHKSRHFLAFLFRSHRNGDGDKKLSPSKPINWWRKFKNRFRRGVVSTIRRSSSVANFHSTLRTRASLSGHEMCSIGDLSKTLKNSSFYSCDDLLRIQSLRRSSLDSTILCRVAGSPAQQQTLKLAGAPRHATAVPKCGISPVPPFCAPPFFTIDASKAKMSAVISAVADGGKAPRLTSTVIGLAGSASTISSARLSTPVLAHRAAARNASLQSVQDKRVSSTSVSPPVSDLSCVGKTGSDCSSSWNDQRSLASINAAKLGTGKSTPPRIPLSRKPSYTPLPIPLPKKASSVCDLSLPLRRAVTPSQPSVSASSSGSTATAAGMAPNYRMKRPQALYIGSNNGNASAFIGSSRKSKTNRVLRRPHSYHDAAMESAAVYAMPYSGAIRKLRTGAPLNLGRPCSYQDPVANSCQTLNDLPITPTRKSFNFFASDVPSTFHSKYSSTPHLAASLSNSSGRSSVITPIRRPTQYAVSPTNFIPHGNVFFPSIMRDGKDFVQHTLWQLSLERYADIFREQEVDMETFLTLTDSDLKDLGISDGSHRNEILLVARRTLNYCLSQRMRMNDVREVQNEKEDDTVG